LGELPGASALVGSNKVMLIFFSATKYYYSSEDKYEELSTVLRK
jgi:hypothetical protein